MRRLARGLGTLLIVAGLGAMLWAVVVWRWQDPFTALYARYEQGKLVDRYEERLARFRPAPASAETSADELRRRVAALARRYRRTLAPGDPVGRLKVPRLGLDVIVVNGTDSDVLKRGPGRYLGSYMPGEGELVYVAGHRTTYGAPFSRIDALRPRDRVTLELPYATFQYEIRGHRVVASTYVAALESHGREVLALQACWPRFRATHRYIAYANPVRVVLRSGRAFSPRTVA